MSSGNKEFFRPGLNVKRKIQYKQLEYVTAHSTATNIPSIFVATLLAVRI